MKILIVDDQPDVVKGILSGVNWERVGVDAAFGAHSGEEAKQVLQEEHIDILLCDIEMPGENGLEFFSWVRERYQDVKCIFLTAHADFTYAQKALKLEAADYLLQPASYAGVESSILRVSERIREEQLVRSYSSVGKDVLREAIGFRRNILREFLQGVQMSAQEAAEKAGVFGFPCTPDTRCRCFWLQIQRWEGKPWEYGLLIYGMQNILSELLEECSSHVTLFHGGKDAYPVVMIAEGSDRRKEEEAMAQFCETCRSLFRMEVSCYAGPSTVLFRELPEEYLRLQEVDRNNVTRSTGFLPLEGTVLPTDYFPDFPKWKSLLGQGYGGAVREEIHRYFETLAEAGSLNRELLARFHEDFLELFFGVIQSYQERAHEIFSETYDYDAMLHASTSLPQLLEFVDFATRYVEEKQDTAEGNRAQIDRVLDFIRENLPRNIGRQEIAKAVYLNPEYLSRLFKKKMGIGLNEYLVQERMKIAESLLRNTSFSISIIASKVGYVNFSHFARAFKKEFGVSPTEYRKECERDKPEK